MNEGCEDRECRGRGWDAGRAGELGGEAGKNTISEVSTGLVGGAGAGARKSLIVKP